jgi:hypothetical protein
MKPVARSPMELIMLIILIGLFLVKIVNGE